MCWRLVSIGYLLVHVWMSHLVTTKAYCRQIYMPTCTLILRLTTWILCAYIFPLPGAWWGSTGCHFIPPSHFWCMTKHMHHNDILTWTQQWWWVVEEVVGGEACWSGSRTVGPLGTQITSHGVYVSLKIDNLLLGEGSESKCEGGSHGGWLKRLWGVKLVEVAAGQLDL